MRKTAEILYEESDTTNLSVLAGRLPDSPIHQRDIIPVNIIEDVYWDRISGGVQKTFGFWGMYARVPYDYLSGTCIACSNRHNYGYNLAKIYIYKQANLANSTLRPGYEYLLQFMGPQPKSIISSNRPINQPVCTKKILNLLQIHGETGILRCDLINELESLGYKHSTIVAALRRISKNQQCLCYGSPQSIYQRIFRLK